MSAVDDAAVEQAQRVSRKIRKLLRGIEPQVQSAILADLLSLWLAGHYVIEEIGQAEHPQTDAVRRDLLDFHIALVRELIPVQDTDIIVRLRRSGAGRKD